MEEMITEYMIAKQRLEIVLRIKANDNVIFFDKLPRAKTVIKHINISKHFVRHWTFSIRLGDSISLLIQEELNPY